MKTGGAAGGLGVILIIAIFFGCLDMTCATRGTPVPLTPSTAPTKKEAIYATNRSTKTPTITQIDGVVGQTAS
jgi:hypothetical protein